MFRTLDNDRRDALVALTVATVLFGLTVPLTKVALAWLDPAWLTTVRFALATPVLAWLGRRALAQSATREIAAAGAVGYGIVVLLQNEGVERTSVLHATVILGAVPALVAFVALSCGRGSASGRTWTGIGLALLGMSVVAGSGGSSSMIGDLLVLASAALMAAFTVAQAGLLRGRDPVAVTAIQMAAAAATACLFAVPTGAPPMAAPATEVAAVIALILAGTLLPFALFARGQASVAPETAGAFLNVEPLVGATIGVVAFGDHLGVLQVIGAAAVLAGIALSIERPSVPARARPSDVVVEMRAG